MKEDSVSIRSRAIPLAWLILALSPLLTFDWGGTLLFLAIGIYLGFILSESYSIWSHTRGRVYTNAITIIRSGILLTAGLAGSEFPPFGLAVLLWTAAILDVADGWVARKMNGETRFGGFFDEEVDALFVLVVCYLLWRTEMGYWWIMLAGWIRYFVVIMKSIFPPRAEILPKFKWARTLAGLSFVLLPLALIIPGPIGLAIQWIALCLILFSFTRELLISYEH